MRVGRNGRERLVQLVSNARGHLADRGEARDMHQSLLQAMSFGIRFMLCSVVADETNQSWWIGPRDHPHGEKCVKRGAVLASCYRFTARSDNPRHAGCRQYADVGSKNIPRLIAEDTLRRLVECHYPAE